MPPAKYNCCHFHRVTVTNASQTLAQLGIAVDSHASRISFQNAGAVNIFMNDGPADGNSFILFPTGAVTPPVGYRDALGLQFISAGADCEMNILEMGDE